MKNGLLVACAALAGVGPATAEPARLSATETLGVAWLVDNHNARPDDDDYGYAWQRLVLSGGGGGADVQARVDGVAYLSPPEGDGYTDDLRLERLNARYESGAWSGELGDSHLQLGRGIALSLRPVEAAGVDVALRGGQIRHEGRVFGAGIFAGHTNTANLDTVSHRMIDDVDDRLLGARLRLSLGPAEAQVWGLHLKPEESILEPDDTSSTVGGSVELAQLTGWLSIYGEADLQRRTLAGTEDDGWALYGAVDLAAGETQVLVEVMRLARFEQRGSRHAVLGRRFEYNRPPTLERFDQEVFDSRDVQGGRVRVERPLGDAGLVAHLNGLLRMERPEEASALTQVHGYGGVEFDGASGVHLGTGGGYREEESLGRTVKSLAHGEWDAMVPLAGPWALQTGGNLERRTLEGDPHLRGTGALGVERGGWGALTAELGWDDQDTRAEVRNLFVAGLLSLRLPAAIELSAAVGTQRGGIRCVSGVCREYPAFAGARMELSGRL